MFVVYFVDAIRKSNIAEQDFRIILIEENNDFV
jgi:hypothetical protein